MAKAEQPSGLQKLFEDQVADLYYAEKKLLVALKKMAKTAEDKDLADAFLDHREETQGQIERLEKIFELLGKKAKGKKCHAIEGLLKEADEIMDDFKGDPALDAALVCAAQKVEHYEIGSYGTIHTYAETLGHKEAAKLLAATLKEEKGSDVVLTKLAVSTLNRAGEAHHKQAKASNGQSSNGRQSSKTSSSKASDKSHVANSAKSSTSGKSSPNRSAKSASAKSGKKESTAKSSEPINMNKTKQSRTPSTTG